MATANENTPQRRIEDHKPDAKIDWTDPDAPAVPQSSTAGAAKGGITSLEGLTRYGFCDINDDNFIERPDGGYVKFADIERLLAAPSQAEAPQTGWKLVPAIPTPKMLDAAHLAENCGHGDRHFLNAYCAMLAAAPIPPSTAPAPADEPLHQDVEWLVECAEMARKNPELATQIRAKCKVDRTAPAPQTDELPTALFDGHAVYEEITRHLGKGHCFSPDAVSTTLDAVVRLMRAERKEAAPAPQQSESIDTPEFRNLLGDMLGAYRKEMQGGPSLAYEKARQKFITHINEKLAKAAQAAPSAPTEAYRKFVEDWAADAGWDRNGDEGAFEYVRRISYELGQEDASKAAPSAKAEEVRDQALEEAAKACERVAGHNSDMEGKTELVWNCVAAIRALRTPSTTKASEQQGGEADKRTAGGDSEAKNA